MMPLIRWNREGRGGKRKKNPRGRKTLKSQLNMVHDRKTSDRISVRATMFAFKSSQLVISA